MWNLHKLMMSTSLFLVGAVIMALPVRADDLPLPTITTMSRGVMCDTAEHVDETLSNYSATNITMAETCSLTVFTNADGVRIRLPVLMTAVHWYESDVIRALVVQIRIPPTPANPEGLTQFGWVSFQLKEPPIEQDLGEEA